jgi:hypothetical protein
MLQVLFLFLAFLIIPTSKPASFSPHSLLIPCTKRVTLFVDKARQNGKIDKTQPPFIALLPQNHFA